MDLGLFLLRVVVGALLAGHGAQKLMGWFDGSGLRATGQHFESIGYRPGRPYAALAGLAEVIGGALLFLGLFTPVAAAILIGQMLNAAVSVHAKNGLWVTKGGYEYPLVLGVVGVMFGFTSAGAWSADYALGLGFDFWLWGFFALAAGLIVGGIVLGARQTEPETEIDLRTPAAATETDETSSEPAGRR
jgi:putative oxidoreductase